MSKIQKTDHFYLIDGSGYIFRAYYALPPLSRKSDGLPTGAVSGFCSMLFKLLEDSKSNENLKKPSHFAVIFDSARKTFRNDIYKDYKANRSEAPDDLIPQFDILLSLRKIPKTALLIYSFCFHKFLLVPCNIYPTLLDLDKHNQNQICHVKIKKPKFFPLRSKEAHFLFYSMFF